MKPEHGIDEWPEEFTREEMLEQHAHLLEEECRLLNEELSRYRKHLAKLIEMHSGVSTERDELRTQLAGANAYITKLNSESYETDRRIGALKNILGQRDAVMRQFKIPEDYFGSPWTNL